MLTSMTVSQYALALIYREILSANTAQHAEQTNHTNIHTSLTKNHIIRSINLLSRT